MKPGMLIAEMKLRRHLPRCTKCFIPLSVHHMFHPFVIHEY
jgi:hypothetical protein